MATCDDWWEAVLNGSSDESDDDSSWLKNHITFLGPAFLSTAQHHPRPTDAEIIQRYTEWQHKGNAGNLMLINGYTLDKKQYQAAWSRELKRRVEKSKEADSRKIVCEGTLPEDY